MPTRRSQSAVAPDRPQNEILNVSLYRRVRIDVGVGSEERDGYDTATHNNERLIRFERTKRERKTGERDREEKRGGETRARQVCLLFRVRPIMEALERRGSRRISGASGDRRGVPRELAPRTSILRKDTYPSSSYSRQTARREHRAVIDDNTRA